MEDHVGEKFGDMVIIEHLSFDKHNNQKVKVKCEKCGRTKEVPYHKLKKGSGASHKWCTLQVKKDKNFQYKWDNIQHRIYDTNCEQYHNYGGRGIKCEWKYFIDFYDDMYESYSQHVEKYGKENTTIERINVNGNYCKENCTWATLKEQCSNRRTNKWFKATSPDGIEFVSNNQTEFARLHNLNSKKINSCLNNFQKTHKKWKFEYMEEC